MSAPSPPAWLRGRRPTAFYIASAFCLIALFILFSSLPYNTKPVRPNHDFAELVTADGKTWSYNPAKDSRNLGLSDEQCDAAFPALYTELDRTRDYFGPRSIRQDRIKLFREKRIYYHSQVHVLIYNGQMYIINEHKGACDKQRGLAGLANLYRAIISVPDPTTIPNVEFILDTEDTPTQEMPDDRVVWGWTRPMGKLGTWVAPDFDGWAFPISDLGAYVSFRERLKLDEMPFEEKDPRAVWRGTPALNKLRNTLMNVTEGKDWADVQHLVKETRMLMTEFCNYKFPIHTEGNTWSGRLRYLHNCNSATVVHQPLEYQAHYYDLLVADGPEQNYISVANDWSDLEEKIEYYRANPDEAARIAKNSVDTFRDRYLTPAAEACYWRRMIRNWAEVQAFAPSAYEEVKGKDGKTRMVQRGLDWEIYAHPDSNYELKFPEDSKHS
ncbi:Lipopolysaccharide-modifying protein [Macrophomina phaseolina MS6]|uniref:Lipopolysaccharide-modifying protein n=1 Tax=Macrophomina phaseolina (strain MS6) TaxID=1126212 RepID=K2RS05_MACPH|nr:Lipopolysaccharide-modifying protein [Macrophomina phaseolina MS6]